MRARATRSRVHFLNRGHRLYLEVVRKWDLGVADSLRGASIPSTAPLSRCPAVGREDHGVPGRFQDSRHLLLRADEGLKRHRVEVRALERRHFPSVPGVGVRPCRRSRAHRRAEPRSRRHERGGRGPRLPVMGVGEIGDRPGGPPFARRGWASPSPSRRLLRSRGAIARFPAPRDVHAQVPCRSVAYRASSPRH
jgi:hypothetical protein